jgi:hypothetical protein
VRISKQFRKGNSAKFMSSILHGSCPMGRVVRLSPFDPQAGGTTSCAAA